jgi:hypothetical protein
MWRGGMIHPLGVLPGYLACSVSGINDAGVVVGTLSQLRRGSFDGVPLCRWRDERTATAARRRERLGIGHQRRGTILGRLILTAAGLLPTRTTAVHISRYGAGRHRQPRPQISRRPLSPGGRLRATE